MLPIGTGNQGRNLTSKAKISEREATPRASPLGGVGAGGMNRSARRRCSFRRKREEDIGASDNAYYVVLQRKCHCFLVARALASTNTMPRYRMTLPLRLTPLTTRTIVPLANSAASGWVEFVDISSITPDLFFFS